MKNAISVLEFRRLLHEMKDRRAEMTIRFRVMGQMWEPFFMSIGALSEHGATFLEGTRGELKRIDDLSQIIQFEVDRSFMGYQPHFHYEIRMDEPFMQTTSAGQQIDLNAELP
jgi:hypothetical protein